MTLWDEFGATEADTSTSDDPTRGIRGSKAELPAGATEPSWGESSGRRWIRRIFWPMFGLSLFAVFAAWAVSSPSGSAPDDDFHLASSWCAVDRAGPACDRAGSVAGGIEPVWVPERIAGAACYAFKARQSASCQDRLGETLAKGRANAGIYPSGYYLTMHLLIDGVALDRSVVVARCINAGIATLLILAAVGNSISRLGRATALTWLVMLVPLGVFFVPSTNPSAWAFVGVGTYWVFLLRFLERPRGRGAVVAALLTVLSAALALVSRTDAAAYLCVTSVACVLVSSVDLKYMLAVRNLLPLSVTLTAFLVFISSKSSQFVVSGATPLDGSAPGRSGLPLLRSNLLHLPNYFVGVFGWDAGLGWLDTVLPRIVGAITIAMAIVAVLLSSRSRGRYPALALVGMTATVIGVPLLILQQSHAFVGEIVQPRYIYPLVLVLLGLWLYGPQRTATRHVGRVFPYVAAIAIGIANSVALHSNIRRYVTGVDVHRLNLDVGVQWWWSSFWFSPMAVWLAGTAAGFVAFVGFAIRASQWSPTAKRDPSGDRDVLA